MNNFCRKILAGSLVLFLFFSLGQTILGKEARAANKPADMFNVNMQRMSENEQNLQNLEEADGKARITGERGILFQQTGNLSTFACLLMPCKGISDYQSSAVGNIAMLMDTMYTHPPASAIAYTVDIMQTAGLLAKPAQAQGIGFSALSPFLPFWKVTRNISYMLLIAVMVAIGFMIIFRTKIDPKTVIGVQAALPKIILTLILITFSYPIVGFMVDLMYLVMAIALSLMISGAGGDIGGATVSNLQSTYMSAGLMDLLGAVFWPVQAIYLGVVKGSLGLGSLGTGVSFGYVLQLILLKQLGSIPLIGATAVSPWGIILGFALPSLIFAVVVGLGLLYTFIRLLLLLANSYIQLLIALILGPILLLGEAIPGRSAFSEWFLNILANLVVFPATAVVILFSVWLATNDQLANSWNPPFIGAANPAGGTFHSMLSLAVMFMAPTLVATIKKAFHPKPLVPASIGSAFAPATAAIGTGMGAGQSLFYSASMLRTARGILTGKKEPDHPE